MELKEAIALVKPPNDSEKTIYDDGNVWDIIKAVLIADKIAAFEQSVTKLAKRLKGKTEFETCENIWNFIKKNIPYVADTLGHERIRKPNKAIFDAFYKKNGGDCKSFSVLATALLRANGIKSKYRFISQQILANPSHVYTIANLKNGENVIIDAVFAYFNKEPKYFKVWDYPAAEPPSEKIQGIDLKLNTIHHIK